MLENCSGQKGVVVLQYTLQLTHRVAAGGGENKALGNHYWFWFIVSLKDGNYVMEVVRPWG